MKCKSSSWRGLNRFPIPPASLFQQGKGICSGPVYSVPYGDRIPGSLSAHLTVSPLYYMQAMWPPQGRWPPDHGGLCSRALPTDMLHRASPCHITVFSSLALLRGRKGKKLERSHFWHGHHGRAIGRRAAALARRQQQWGPCARPAGCRAQTWSKVSARSTAGEGRAGGARGDAALSQSRKKGRPWAFPVVQLKQAKTSLHLHSLRVSADWGPKFSHFQCTARREVLEEKPAVALLLTAVLCTCIAKQLSGMSPGSAAKDRVWLETIFAPEPCCSCFSCTACVRMLLQYRNALSSRYRPYCCKHLETNPLDPMEENTFCQCTWGTIRVSNCRIPLSDTADNPAKQIQTLLLSFAPAFPKQVRIHLQEKGAGTGAG